VGKSGNPARRAEQVKPVNSASKGEVMVCWCDNGTVDGKFMEGVVYSILTSDVPISGAQRVQGNQIGRQREAALEMWYENSDKEWLLWIDSDICITNQVLELVWNSADPVERPVVSGTYFISKQMEQSIMQPFPALFLAHEDKYTMSYVHPLPTEPQLIKVDYAGFGFLLMHRSAIDKMKAFHKDKPFFLETMDSVNKETFIGEDIQFFMRMKEAGVPLYAHTGALVRHIKRFSFDYDFYRLYWATIGAAELEARMKLIQEEEAKAQASAPSDTASSD